MALSVEPLLSRDCKAVAAVPPRKRTSVRLGLEPDSELLMSWNEVELAFESKAKPIGHG